MHGIGLMARGGALLWHRPAMVGNSIASASDGGRSKWHWQWATHSEEGLEQKKEGMRVMKLIGGDGSKKDEWRAMP